MSKKQDVWKRYYTDPYNPKPVWDNFRGLFRAVNAVNPALTVRAYNGGLFADDPRLEQLAVPDEVCKTFQTLAGYDYRPTHQAARVAENGTVSNLIDVDSEPL